MTSHIATERATFAALGVVCAHVCGYMCGRVCTRGASSTHTHDDAPTHLCPHANAAGLGNHTRGHDYTWHLRWRSRPTSVQHEPNTCCQQSTLRLCRMPLRYVQLLNPIAGVVRTVVCCDVQRRWQTVHGVLRRARLQIVNHYNSRAF